MIKRYKCELVLDVYDSHRVEIIDYLYTGCMLDIHQNTTGTQVNYLTVTGSQINKLIRKAGYKIPSGITWIHDDSNDWFSGSHPSYPEGFATLRYRPSDITVVLSRRKITALVRKQLMALMHNDSFAGDMAMWVDDGSIRNPDSSRPQIEWSK